MTVRGTLTRWAWAALGLLCLALGAVGAVVPGLPTTIFVLAAAACFARSSPRLEAWLLARPRLGRLIRDHRAGLGMPRRAKVVSVTSIALAGALSVAVTHGLPAVQVAIAVACAIGIAQVVWRVPTRETVLAERSQSDPVDRSGRGPAGGRGRR